MNKIILYHGSPEIITHPIYGYGKTFNDYGQGFYCTKHLELAKEWAYNFQMDGYANRYEIDIDNLSILNLLDSHYTILNWLAILMDNRIPKLTNPISKKSRDYLIEHFLPNYKNYDIIIGYRADDSYYAFTRAFISNEISLAQLRYAMALGKLGEQYVLMSQKAFSSLHFLDYSIADHNIYYEKRQQRDEAARKSFLKEIENEDLEGIYMRDIMREGFKNDDPRLQ